MVPSQADPRGDPDYDHVAAQIVARLIELPRRAVVLAEDEHPRVELLYGARYQQWPAGRQHSKGDSYRAV